MITGLKSQKYEAINSNGILTGRLNNYSQISISIIYHINMYKRNVILQNDSIIVIARSRRSDTALNCKFDDCRFNLNS